MPDLNWDHVDWDAFVDRMNDEDEHPVANQRKSLIDTLEETGTPEQFVDDIDLIDIISFVEAHNTNIVGAQFEIGETVVTKFNNNEFKMGSTAEITGVNKLDENVFEYSIAEYPFPFWENELRRI
jgi:hypothetical protein